MRHVHAIVCGIRMPMEWQVSRRRFRADVFGKFCSLVPLCWHVKRHDDTRIFALTQCSFDSLKNLLRRVTSVSESNFARPGAVLELASQSTNSTNRAKTAI